LSTVLTGPVLAELLAAARMALWVHAAPVAADAVVVDAAAAAAALAAAAAAAAAAAFEFVVVVVAAAVDVVVVLADWLLGLLEQPASTAAPIRTAITPLPVALVIPSSPRLGLSQRISPSSGTRHRRTLSLRSSLI
jgi:hypothetical protein